jgi:hypothetical protein
LPALIDSGKKLYTEWNLSRGTSYDVWGAPNHSWAKSGTTFVTYTDTPVLTYTKAVTAHDLLIDLGVAATSGSTKTVDYVVRNGALLDSTTADSNETKLILVIMLKDAVLKHDTTYKCMTATTSIQPQRLVLPQRMWPMHSECYGYDCCCQSGHRRTGCSDPCLQTGQRQVCDRHDRHLSGSG